MVRKFMSLKRKPILAEGKRIGSEPWLDWQIRSMSRAGAETRSRNLEACHLLTRERLSWAGHVARFGLDDKPAHIGKYLVSWRPLVWLRTGPGIWKFVTMHVNVYVRMGMCHHRPNYS